MMPWGIPQEILGLNLEIHTSIHDVILKLSGGVLDFSGKANVKRRCET